MPVILFIYDYDCPNVEAARANLSSALTGCGLPPNWDEHRIGDPEVPQRAQGFGSPTILVDGKDVAGATPEAEQCCRAYETEGGVPRVEVIAAAIKDAVTKGSGRMPPAS